MKLPNLKISAFSISIFLSLILYIFALTATFLDTEFYYRWLIFAIWIISISLPFLLFFWQKRSSIKTIASEILSDRRELLFFTFVIGVAIIANFSFLHDYPFVSIYDQVRDGGLNTQEIWLGQIKNIFSYGRYFSHGLIIPTLTNFFLPIFKHSVLTFRFPAALISILDIIIIYWLARKIINKKAAFWTALILLSFPLHLYFARTEIVVIWSSFLTSLMLITLYYLFKYNRWEYFLMIGLICGFASGFHTSIRTIALITMAISIIWLIFQTWLHFNKTRVVSNFIIIVFFYLVGFGPRLLYTTPEIFFQTRSINLIQTGSIHQASISQLTKNYLDSFLVLFTKPTISTHYPNHQPLFTPVLAILFLIGLIVALFSKNNFYYILCTYTLIIPFTNSAITDSINSDNRLLPLLPVSALLITNAISIILSFIKKNSLRISLFFQILLFSYLMVQIFNFFWQEPANKNYGQADYLSMYTIYFIQDNALYQKSDRLCLTISPDMLSYFKLLHVQEQYQYFIPKRQIDIFVNDTQNNNEIYISVSCQPLSDTTKSQFLTQQYCKNYQKFLCPKQGSITLHYEKHLPSQIIQPFSNLSSQPIFSIPKNPQFIP